MKKSASSTDTAAIDSRISAMVRSEAPDVPADPWFVRKTLNRLPERSRRLAGIPEIAAIAIAIIVSVVITAVELHSLATGGEVAFNPLLLFSASGLLLFLTFVLAMPVLRRCWN